jgi:hypothetical protein
LSFEIGQWYLVCGCMTIRRCVVYHNDLRGTLTFDLKVKIRLKQYVSLRSKARQNKIKLLYTQWQNFMHIQDENKFNKCQCKTGLNLQNSVDGVTKFNFMWCVFHNAQWYWSDNLCKLVTDQWQGSLGVHDSESCWFTEFWRHWRMTSKVRKRTSRNTKKWK